jgi:integrase
VRSGIAPMDANHLAMLLPLHPMFVRFRQAGHRLQASLIETRRVDGKVRHEHIASLGSIILPPSVVDRITFWNRLHERLAKLSNRIDAETHGKVLGAVHARVPMVTADEQVALQLENAKADARFWDTLADMHGATVQDHKGLAAPAERTAAEGEVERAKAAEHAARAKERVERNERVRATMRGIRRSLGTARAKKAPATAERIVAMALIPGERLADIRDRALLLFGFASAMRRSELAALNFEDIEETADGLRVTLRRSKTDQEGHGDVIAVPRGTIACPVAAFKAWLDAAAIATGPVFRPIAKGERVSAARLTDRSIATIVKAHAARVGLDPATFAGHSLRSGFLTSAAARGASIFKMADQSRHKSMDTLRGYVRDAEIFKDHAGKGLL